MRKRRLQKCDRHIEDGDDDVIDVVSLAFRKPEIINDVAITTIKCF